MRLSRSLLLLLAVVLVAGCGGSKPKGPPALVFDSTRDGDYALFGADADGKHEHRLTKDHGDASSPARLFFQVEPAWSPNGRMIAFVSHRGDGIAHVYVMNADGSGTRRVTDSSQDDDRPAWSPDGSRIVFSREGALFETPVAGGPVRRVVHAPGAANDPAWSPDGKWIAYDYRQPGFSTRELYVVHPDGTGNRQLTQLNAISALPAWAPDSTRLAFESNVYQGHFEIYTLRLSGGPAKRLTASAIDTIQPAWGRNGAVAFSRDGAIWVTRNGKETRLTNGKDNDSAPSWRPGQPQ